MTASPLDIKVQDIDQCGIVAGICDEMELVEQINGNALMERMAVKPSEWNGTKKSGKAYGLSTLQLLS